MDPALVEAYNELSNKISVDVGSLLVALAKGNPMAEMVGWRFESFDEGAETLDLSFEPQPCFCNMMGMIHGGFVATMLDEVMGSAVFAVKAGRQIGATISATVEFVRPAMLGRIYGTGRIRHMGKSIAFVDGELADSQGKLVAKASASFKIVDLPERR